MVYIFYSNRWPYNYKNTIDDPGFYKLLKSKYENVIALDNSISYIDYNKNYTINDFVNIYDIEKNDLIFASYCSKMNFVIEQGNTAQISNNSLRLGFDLLRIQKDIGCKVYNNLELVRFTSNKQRLNCFCKKYNIKIPKTIYVSNFNFIKSIIPKFPMVLKPVNGSGGIGCFKVNNFEELLSMSKFIFSTGNEVIIQEFVDSEYELRVITIGKDICTKVDKTFPTDLQFKTRENNNVEDHILLQDEINFINYIVECLYNEFDNIAQLGFDIKRGKDGQLYFLEVNNLPGMENYYTEFSDWIIKQIS